MKRALLLVALAACQQRTELMIGVATDIRAPDAIDGAQLVVTRVDNGVVEESVPWDITGVADLPFNLPGSYGIFSDGTEVKVDLVLTGTKGGNPVVSRHAILGLVDDQTLFFRMSLTVGCINKTDCAPTESCVEGACQDVHVDPLQLPSFTQDLVTAISCNSGTVFIDTGTGQPMPEHDDGQECPAGLCSEGTCLNPAPPPDPSQKRGVSGFQATTNVETNRTTTKPADLSTLHPTLFEPAMDGTIDVTMGTPGTGSADGTFSFANVPEGPYVLQIGTSWYETSADQLDLSNDVVGRVDKVQPTLSTPITLNLTNLDAWQDGDSLEAYSAGADTWWFDLEQSVTATPLTAGQTSLTNFTFDQTEAVTSSTLTSALIRGDEGDGFIVVHLAGASSSEGTHYVAAKSFFTPANPIVQTDGNGVSLTGAFTPVTQDQTLSISAHEGDFEAAVGFSAGQPALLTSQPAFPNVLFDNLSINVLGNVGGNQFGNIGATADYMFLDVPTGQPIVTATNVRFGTPMVPNEKWGVMFDVRWTFAAAVQLPGTMSPAFLFAGVFDDVDLASVPAGPVVVEPVLGPVVQPTVNGQSLFSPQTMTTTPTFAWQAPSLGGAREYSVVIFQLTTPDGMQTVHTQIATFETSGTQVIIPAGVLTSSSTYVVQIIASTNPNPNAPNRQVLQAQSIVLSANLTTTDGP